MIVFDIGFVYFMFALFCAMVIGMTINRTQASEYEEVIDRPFCRLLYFFMAFCTVDAIWGLLTSATTKNSQFWYTIFTYGFHFMSALSAVAWSEYLLIYIGIEKKQRAKLWLLRGAILAAQMVILFSNIWNRKFFWVDENAVYHAYQMRHVMFYLQMSYYVIIALYCLWERFYVQRNNGDRMEMKKYTSAVIFSFFPLVSGYLQMLFPDGSMYSGGFMFSAVVIYTFNVTTQREKYFTAALRNENRKLSAIVTGLSGDYLRIYYVARATGAYEEYANRGGNTVRVGGGENLFNDQELLSHVVVAEDEHVFREMMTRENVIRELQDKESFSFNYRRMVDGKEKYCLAKIIRTESAPAEDGLPAGDHIVMGVFDDDERVRTQMEYQQQLEVAMKQANSASKAKSDFLFNMSHDIRTPMNAINGFTEMALRHIDDKEVVENSLEKVEMAGNHLLSIINDVLDMARIESGKMNLTEASGQIRPMCENLYEMTSGLAGKGGLEFVHSYTSVKNENVFFDEGHLSQILMNLLSNAVKYTPAGGKVEFTTEQLDDIAPGYATYRFTVSDTGLGMSEEFLAHIFDEFAREKNATQSGIQGTGLGMAIVKKLADLMNGSLNITSRQGRGTKCVFTASFKRDAAADDNNNNNNNNNNNLAGRRVLLVEDNELNREIACDILDDFDMEVDTAEDGDIAVEKFAAAAEGTYDLILMDVQMPRMNGYDATRAIRALPGGKGAKVPIIAMTANAFQEDKEDARAAGMNAHLAKPIRIEELQKTMASFL